MYTKFNAINTKKINNEILKAFNGTKTKDIIISEKEEKFYICFSGACLFELNKYFFPFDLTRIAEYTENNRIVMNNNLCDMLPKAQPLLDSGELVPAQLEKLALIEMNKSATVMVYKDSRGIRHGINKEFTDFLQLENCRVYGNKANEPLYFTDSNNKIVACILPIKPKTDNWE